MPIGRNSVKDKKYTYQLSDKNDWDSSVVYEVMKVMKTLLILMRI